MSPDELRNAGIRLFGPYGWQTRLANELGVNRSTVVRWAGGQVPVSPIAEAAILCWLREADRCQGAGPDPA